MPECPECNKTIRSPAKVWSITDHAKSGNLVERHVGLYECGKCNAKFPYVYGGQKLKIVRTKDLEKLKEDNGDLTRKVNELICEKEELQTSIERIELEHLSSRARELQESVNMLKEWRSEVQSEITPLLATKS